MPKKRQELVVGQWDNITQRCPGMSYRLSPYAREELVAWLTLMQSRYARAAVALHEAAKNGSIVQSAIDHNTAAVTVIQQLIDRIGERWSAADWRTACDLAVQTITSNPSILLAALGRDGASVPLEAHANATDGIRSGGDIQRGS